MLESAVKKRDRLQFKLDTIIAKAQAKIGPAQDALDKAEAVVGIYAPKDENGQPKVIPYTVPDIKEKESTVGSTKEGEDTEKKDHKKKRQSK